MANMAISQILDNWVGSYSGKMNAIQLNGNKNEFSMRIDVDKVEDHIYSWTLTYGDSGKDIRPYQVVHDHDNKFIMDEKNGIKIQMSRFDDELISLFEVMDSYIFVSYKLVEAGMEVNIISAYGRSETGGSMDEDGNVIPNVGSYSVVASQNVLLKKIE